MKQKKIPLRMCAGCGEMKPKKELVRVVRAPVQAAENGVQTGGEVSLDLTCLLYTSIRKFLLVERSDKNENCTFYARKRLYPHGRVRKVRQRGRLAAPRYGCLLYTSALQWAVCS